MSPGKKWERKFQKICKDSKIFCYRLKDSPSSFFKGDEKIRFSNSNISDFFVYFDGKLFITELKTTASSSLPFVNFSNHQISEFNNIIDKYIGVEAIVFIEMRRYNESYLLRWKDMSKKIIENTRKSWSYDFIRTKGIKLENTDFEEILRSFACGELG